MCTTKTFLFFLLILFKDTGSVRNNDRLLLAHKIRFWCKVVLHLVKSITLHSRHLKPSENSFIDSINIFLTAAMQIVIKVSPHKLHSTCLIFLTNFLPFIESKSLPLHVIHVAKHLQSVWRGYQELEIKQKINGQ